jgi:hypothetical protein
MYNTETLYGLTALDIDGPQKGLAVSVELEIALVKGNSCRARLVPARRR